MKSRSIIVLTNFLNTTLFYRLGFIYKSTSYTLRLYLTQPKTVHLPISTNRRPSYTNNTIISQSIVCVLTNFIEKLKKSIGTHFVPNKNKYVPMSLLLQNVW